MEIISEQTKTRENKVFVQSKKPAMNVNDGYLRLCGMMVASIMPLNDVCDTYVTQAIHTIKWFVPNECKPTDYDTMTEEDKLAWDKKWLAKHTWYKHSVKKWGNAERAALDVCLSSAVLKRTSREMDELEYEFHDQYEARLKPYTDALYWTIRNAMAKAGYSADRGDLLAKVMQACTMLAATVGMYEESIDYYRGLCGADFSPTFCSLHPIGAYKASRQLAMLIADKIYIKDKPIDLSHDKDVLRANQAIFTQIRRREHVDAAEAQAMAEYADRMDEVPDSWREKMKQLEIKLNS